MDEPAKTMNSEPKAEISKISEEEENKKSKNEILPDNNENISSKVGKISHENKDEKDKPKSKEEDAPQTNDDIEDEETEEEADENTLNKDESSNEDYKKYLEEIKVKKRKEHKFDEMYDKEIENAQDEWLSMMVYCPICKKNVFAWYRKSIIEKATSYPVYIVWVHGEPNHGLLYRVDKDLVSRGEKPVVIEYDPNLYNNS